VSPGSGDCQTPVKVGEQAGKETHHCRSNAQPTPFNDTHAARDFNNINFATWTDAGRREDFALMIQRPLTQRYPPQRGGRRGQQYCCTRGATTSRSNVAASTLAAGTIGVK